MVEDHFRYHQFYANTLLALLAGYPVARAALPSDWPSSGLDIGFTLLCVVLFACSRDALLRYYTRTTRLLETSQLDVRHSRARAPRQRTRRGR